MKKRHLFYYKLLRPLVSLFLRLRVGYRCQKAKGLPENYLVVSNHTTNYDMLFAACSFPRQMYFVGSEHIARWGFAYKLIRHAFEPIIRQKGASAGRAVIEILRKLRNGQNVCLFAEGVRSWDGKTAPILPSTAQLIKSAGCGLVTYRITGGYFVSPMWCGSKLRCGKINGAPVRILTKEQIASLSEEEIFEILNQDLYEDAYARQLEGPVKYRGKRLAERLENLMFICPECGGHDCFSSEGDLLTCGSCGLTVRYDEYGMLHGTRFQTVTQWAEWQREQVASDLKNQVPYTAPHAVLRKIEKHSEAPVTEGEAVMTDSVLRCGEVEFALSEIQGLAMHDQRAVVFTAKGGYYELIPDLGSNALKFMLFYDCCKKHQKANKGT